MAPPSQGSEPPANPERFIHLSQAAGAGGQRAVHAITIDLRSTYGGLRFGRKMAMLHSRNRVLALGLVGVLTLALAGCETDKTTSVGDSVRSSGFLSDYSMLRYGGDGQAISVYWNDQVDFNSYTKMLIEPVTIWTNPDAEFNEVPAEERQELANAFHAALQETLSEDFEIVRAPGPNTIRLRVALTEAVASSPVSWTPFRPMCLRRVSYRRFSLSGPTPRLLSGRRGPRARRATPCRVCCWPPASTNAPAPRLSAATLSIRGVMCARRSNPGRFSSAITCASAGTSDRRGGPRAGFPSG